ncbi:MAG: hypothetical protein AAGI23_12280 [Bacteroidota bacterium]
MTTIQSIQIDIISAILKTTDVETLKSVQKQLVEDVESSFQRNIPSVEIQYGVTLEEIKAQQQVKKVTFEEIEEMFAEEKWAT